ncbi:MAG: hypothetical protein WEE03_05925, partial [Chloroflexota bacterium]
GGKLGVAPAARSGEPRAHPFARRDNALADGTRRLATAFAQLLVRDTRDVRAQIDEIEQRARQARVIAVDGIRQAGALLGGITRVPAGGQGFIAWPQRRRD